jgi:hypothetical protein
MYSSFNGNRAVVCNLSNIGRKQPRTKLRQRKRDVDVVGGKTQNLLAVVDATGPPEFKEVSGQNPVHPRPVKARFGAPEGLFETLKRLMIFSAEVNHRTTAGVGAELFVFKNEE